MTRSYSHTPVLLTETIEALQPQPGRQYIDATLGGGGHAERILEVSSPDGRLLGLDVDPDALTASARRFERFAGRAVLVEGYFDQIETVATETGFGAVSGILFDLGVSSPQLDSPERGFSFSADGPLDMRLGPSAPRSAADLVNVLEADELADIFFRYGEERHSRRIAQSIVTARRTAPIRTTGALAAIVGRARPASRGERIHPATRVFQALRIAVNDELGRLQSALPQANRLLAGGGRLVVITFHSLEDRIVKQFIRGEARGCICPPLVPVCMCGHEATVREITRRPVLASVAEVQANPRARSAKLRVAERLGPTLIAPTHAIAPQ